MMTSVISVSPNGVPIVVGCGTSAMAEGTSGRTGAPEIIPKMIAATTMNKNHRARGILFSFFCGVI